MVRQIGFCTLILYHVDYKANGYFFFMNCEQNIKEDLQVVWLLVII